MVSGKRSVSLTLPTAPGILFFTKCKNLSLDVSGKRHNVFTSLLETVRTLKRRKKWRKQTYSQDFQIILKLKVTMKYARLQGTNTSFTCGTIPNVYMT